jgi:hypothetical protein
MECTATFTEAGETIKTVQVPPLEAARIIAFSQGFYDLDLEPDNGVLKLTATANGVKVTVRGVTVDELAKKLIERVK